MTVSKTALGVQVMKDRSVALSAQQRSALILCDGKRTVDDVVKMTSAVGVTLKDLDALAALGLIAMAATMPAPDAQPSLQAFASSEQPEASAASEADYSTALNAAITLCSSLGFKGFSLNLALTGVDSLEKLQKLAPEIRRAAGDAKYKALHELIFGKSI